MSRIDALGLGFILIFAGGMLIFHLLIRKWTVFSFRTIAGLARLRQRVLSSIEDGKRVHISLGKHSLLSQEGAAALAGLRLADEISTLSALSDHPAHITSGDAPVSLLSRDGNKAVYRNMDHEERFDPCAAYMSGVTAFSYVAGSLAEVVDPQTAVNVLLGGFCSEIGLLADAADQRQTLTTCGTSSLAGQAVLYAVADQPLLGEEIYAADAYLQPQTTQTSAALRMQDIFRWLLVVLILAGIAARFAGVL